MCYEIRCSIFDNLSSDDGGTVAKLVKINGNIKIAKCLFKSVSSTAFPGCVYSEGNTIEVYLCSFSFCNAQTKSNNHNSCYGNAIYFYKSNVVLYMVEAFQSSFSTSVTGDTLFILLECKPQNLRNINSSYCYGADGSPSIGCKDFDGEYAEVKYINAIHCIDYCSLEVRSIRTKQNFTCINSNFINTTQNSNFIIHNNGIHLTLTNCVFIMNFNNNFATNTDLMTIYSCISDSTIKDLEFTINTELNIAKFIIIPQNYYKCNDNTISLQKCFIRPYNLYLYCLIMLNY